MRLPAALIGVMVCTSIGLAENPFSRAWNAAARSLGIGHSDGYHQCRDCQPMHAGQGPVLHHAPMRYSPHAETIVHEGVPQYMMPGYQEIPEQYNEPVPQPERIYEPRVAPPAPIANEVETPSALKAPVERESEPISIPSLRSEPSSPSDIQAAPKPELLRVPQPEPTRQRKPDPKADLKAEPKPDPELLPEPEVAPKPELSPQPDPVPQPTLADPKPTEVTPPPVTEPIAEPTPEIVPPKSPAPGNTNDDDLLVPPDTGLLDSVSLTGNRRGANQYRTAPYMYAPVAPRYRRAPVVDQPQRNPRVASRVIAEP